MTAINWSGLAIELGPQRPGGGLQVEEAPEEDPNQAIEDMYAASAYVPVDLRQIREELTQ